MIFKLTSRVKFEFTKILGSRVSLNLPLIYPQRSGQKLLRGREATSLEILYVTIFLNSTNNNVLFTGQMIAFF